MLPYVLSCVASQAQDTSLSNERAVQLMFSVLAVPECHLVPAPCIDDDACGRASTDLRAGLLIVCYEQEVSIAV